MSGSYRLSAIGCRWSALSYQPLEGGADVKLVRDHIPQLIRSEGRNPKTRIADNREYVDLLRLKLQEEVTEYLESKNPEELADVLEVIRALAEHHLDDFSNLETIRKEKARTRGAFKSRIILED